MNARRISSLFALLAALPLVQAQSTVDPTEAGTPESGYFRLMNELGRWRGQYGENWNVVYQSQTDSGSFLYGGSAPALFRPGSDADYFSLARRALQQSYGMHRIDASTLVEDSVTFLPLALAGSTDKVTVQFRQEVNGVPVTHGFANVLFDTAGTVLSIDTTGLPDLAGFATTPAIDASDALAIALAFFQDDTAVAPTETRTPSLVIDQRTETKFRVPKLAWEVELVSSGANVEAEGYRYRIDALTGRLSSRENVIHNDVSGTIRSMATPGAFPDSASNPETNQVMPYLTVVTSQGNAVTDANGNFTIAGATAPVSATVKYEGTFANTQNQAMADYSLVQNLTLASGNSVLMNPASVTNVTPEANTFQWIGKMRDWTRGVNPADAHSDFLATSNVNLNQTCNAYYDGVSVNFFLAGAGCANTGYSGVVLHEMGHWLNDLYSSGNGGDGFGEGNADNFQTYILDDPIVGHDFCGVGCNVRDGNNNRQFCGDCCGACYGEVHADGEVIMGAMWKIRTRLKNALGVGPGGAVANTLLNGWMNAYNDSQIKTIIETHWLTLDDNNGNINDGTPNYTHIDGGFRDQGFPGFALAFVNFSSVTLLPNTTNEFGPYTVNADISAAMNPPISSASLLYRVDGGSFTTVPMSFVSGNTYTADIPGQQSPAKVEYYLTATNSGAQSGTYPSNAPTGLVKFIVGIYTVFFNASFENTSGNNAGWTHGMIATQDDWQRSAAVGATNGSFGQAGDPITAVSGTNIWGNDLGPPGWNGAYQNNVNNWLRSPSINLTGSSGAMLTFKRWLTVEEAIYDQARVKINGTQVWVNQTSGHTLDSSWVDMELDISALADNNPAVQIEFSLQSDGGLVFGGWNIDDVQIVTVDSVCGSPQSYCTPKTTSIATTPLVGFTGTPSLAANDFVVTMTGGIPNKQGLVFWGATQAATPFQGGTLCATAPLHRTPLQTLSGTGSASQPVPIDISMVGTTRNYQWYFRDAGASFGTGLSNALAVDFCD